MDFETIILKKEEHIATITLNRPDKRNAMSLQMMQELVAALEDLADDDDVRVVVITGAEPAFCSGIDVGALAGAAQGTGGSAGWEGMRRFGRTHIQKIFLGLQKIEKPTIAMVNGATIGIGCDLAFVCDMRVGSENARFRNGFVKMGLIPDGGGTWLYTRLMGLGRGLEFLFSGDFLEAEEAYRIGVLNKLVPAADLEKETTELARKIAKGPPIAIRLSKVLAYKALETDLETALETAISYQPLAMTTEDHKEGIMAFLERREADFKGR
ncbi:MAG: enoyl-CoA hydratase/isomerase family protein [Dehalococcoidia bacterium]|nr:enoyl-CoA hydratase/isomerase family protein [Dehalococcoidia bacterium]